MNTLVTCLCAQIVADGGVEPCFCGLMPGEVPLADYTSCDGSQDGMAWVRLVNAYPSVQLGAATTQPGNCGAMLGADIEVGVLRNMPAGDDRGNPPTLAQMNAAVIQAVNDAASARRAILCCNDSLAGIDVMLGQWSPMGPQGGLVGGTWTLAVQVP